LFQRGYNAHVAIDDAFALSELCAFVHAQKPAPRDTPARSLLLPVTRIKKAMRLTFVKKASGKENKPVTALRGIGPKTSQALSRENIFTCAQLKAHFDTHGVEWLRKAVPKGVRWRVVAHSLTAMA